MTGPPPGGDLFEEVYRSAGTAVLGYALRRCPSREDALDVVAETFTTAWRRRADMPPDPADARPWLFGIARRCLANSLRGNDRADRLEQRLCDVAPMHAVPDPALLHERSADGRRVRAALEDLPADDRELLTLIAWEELTPAQAALALGLTPGAARVRLHRARGRLRAALDVPALPEETSHDR